MRRDLRTSIPKTEFLDGLLDVVVCFVVVLLTSFIRPEFLDGLLDVVVCFVVGLRTSILTKPELRDSNVVNLLRIGFLHFLPSIVGSRRLPA